MVRRWAASCLRSSLTSIAAFASRPSSGSSRNSTSGLCSRADGDHHFLLHAFREFVEALAADAGQVEEVEQLAGARAPHGFVEVVQAPHHLQILVGGQRLVERAGFGHEADAALHLEGGLDDVEAGDLGGAGGRLDHPGQDLHRGRLAGAVRPEEIRGFRPARRASTAIRARPFRRRLCPGCRCGCPGFRCGCPGCRSESPCQHINVLVWPRYG